MRDRQWVRPLAVGGFALLIAGIAVFGMGVAGFSHDPLIIVVGYALGVVGFVMLISAFFATLA